MAPFLKVISVWPQPSIIAQSDAVLFLLSRKLPVLILFATETIFAGQKCVPITSILSNSLRRAYG